MNAVAEKPEKAQLNKDINTEAEKKRSISPVKKTFQIIFAFAVIFMAFFLCTAEPVNPEGAGIVPVESPEPTPEPTPTPTPTPTPEPTPEPTPTPENLLAVEEQNIVPLENCVDDTGYAYCSEAAFIRKTGDTMLDEAAQEVLDAIINDSMTKKEKARAIFDFVQGKIRYMGNSDKSNYRIAAIDAITTRTGDCYSYYAAARALLTVAGIDNLEVRRVCDTSDHWWNLVNCGDGWYHFDATPRGGRMPQFVSFMFTDQQAANYTRDTVNVVGYPNYYTFNGDILPERAS